MAGTSTHDLWEDVYFLAGQTAEAAGNVQSRTTGPQFTAEPADKVAGKIKAREENVQKMARPTPATSYGVSDVFMYGM